MVYSFADSAGVFESFDDGDTAHHNGCVWFTKGFVGEEAAEVPGIVSIRGTDSTEGALYRTGANGSAYSLRFVYDHPNSGLQPKTHTDCECNHPRRLGPKHGVLGLPKSQRN
jgi:hypothetical protein